MPGISPRLHPLGLSGGALWPIESRNVLNMVLDNPACDAVMSPICWTKGNDLPFAISFGEQDSDRVQKSNRRLVELLKLQSGSVEMQVMTPARFWSGRFAAKSRRRRLAQC